MGADIVDECGFGVSSGDNAGLVAVVYATVRAASSGMVRDTHARTAIVYHIAFQAGRSMIVDVDSSAITGLLFRMI